MIRLAILNELNIVGVIFRAMFDRDVYILGRMPLIPRFDSLLAAVQRWLLRRNFARDIFTIFPDERDWANVPLFRNRTDLFQRTERWTEGHLSFSRWPKNWEPYGLAFRNIAVKYMSGYYVSADLVRQMRTLFPDRAIKLVGANRDFIAFLNFSYGDLQIERRLSFEPRRIVNGIIFVAVTLIGIGWLIRHMRLASPTSEPIFFGVDFHGREEDVRIVADILEDTDKALFICRGSKLNQSETSPGPGFRAASVLDSRLELAGFNSYMSILLRDGARIFARTCDCSPRLYYEAAKMSLRRLEFRGLCQRYKFDNFWARDDYNFEHILRTHELRAAGAKSLGINHGLPTPEIYQPSWRYIDFDIYYVFGRHLYDAYYRETWSPHMTVTAIGTTGVPHAKLAGPAPARGRDIVFFSTPLKGSETLGVAFEIARRLTNRRMLVKIKRSRVRDGRAQNLIKMLECAPPNVMTTDRDSYELMFEGEFALTGSSTVAVEAIQMGMKTFVIDTLPQDKAFYYRDFPSICVRSADEAVRRIQAIERGEEKYPWADLGSLVDLSGQNPFNVIRRDIGLPPRKTDSPSLNAVIPTNNIRASLHE